MLNDNKTKYYYEDCHFYFWFNGRHSSEFKLFIQAKNDLKIENTTSPSTEYNNAMFQEGSYFLGTSRKQKTFKRKLAAEGLTKEQYRDMMLWLKEGITGFLSFDTDPYWGWTVVLETVSDVNVFYAHDGMIVEFDVTWKTIGSWMATNKYDGTCIGNSSNEQQYQTPGTTDIYNYMTGNIIADNEWGIPAALVQKTEDSIVCNVFGTCNGVQYIDFMGYIPNLYAEELKGKDKKEIKQDSGNHSFVTISKNNKTYSTLDFVKHGDVNYNKTENCKYYGLMNMTFIAEEIAERYAFLYKSTQENGVLQLQPKTPIKIDLTAIQGKNPAGEFNGVIQEAYEHLFNDNCYIITTKPISTPSAQFYVPSGETTLHTHYITISKVCKEITDDGDTKTISFKISDRHLTETDAQAYLVYSNTVTITGLETSNDNTFDLKVHNYNIL